MKQRYASAFNLAIGEALATLTTDERNDLRMYYLDGLKLVHLATHHGISLPSASRRLARARDAILASTRRIVRERLGLVEADVESLLRVVASRLELRISALSEPSKS
jgi:RNA polymerase sigma-70 factor (ECF subfamily)